MSRAAIGRRALLAGSLAALAAACARKVGPATRGAASRVVSLSPNTTEAMFAMGAGAKLVGRSRYCDFPPEALRLPVVGGWVDPNLEAILALSPDLVVGARGPAGPAITEKLAAHGIATWFPSTESMTEIDAMIEGLGERVGAADGARALVAGMRARRDALARALAGKPRPRALLVFGLAPIVVAGPGTFPDEMLRLAGGANVVTTGSGYPTLGIERVIALDPDVVLDAGAGMAPGSPRIAPDLPGWRELRAVREGRVATLADEAVLRPGPRVADGLAAIARALHPGIELR